MKILQSIAEIEQALSSENIIPINSIKLDGYSSIIYSCGCGRRHDISGVECLNFVSAKSIRALLRCENNFYTLTQIKGLFRLQIISHWSFPAVFVERPDDQVPYRYYVNTNTWLDFPTEDKAQALMLMRKAGKLKH